MRLPRATAALGLASTMIVACQLLVGIEDSSPIEDAGAVSDVRVGDGPGDDDGGPTDAPLGDSGCTPAKCRLDLTTTARDPVAVTLDANGLAYWTEFDHGPILRCDPRNCAAKTTLWAATDAASPSGIASASSGIWAVFRNVDQPYRCNGSCTPLPILNDASVLGGVLNLAVSSTSIRTVAFEDGIVGDVDIATGFTVALYSSPGAYIGRIAVGPTLTAWTEAALNRVRTCAVGTPATGGECTSKVASVFVGDTTQKPNGVVFFGSDLYVTVKFGTSGVYRCLGGTQTCTLVVPSDKPEEITSDGKTYVYFTESSPGRVLRFKPTTSGNPVVEPIASVAAAGAIAADANGILVAGRPTLLDSGAPGSVVYLPLR